MRHLPLLFSCLLLAACKAEVVNTAPQGPSDMTASVEFKSLLTQGDHEQDVYIETIKGSGKVYRFEVKPTQKLDVMARVFEKPLYGSTTPVKHDFFKTGSGALGPYERGVRIGVMLKDWGTGRGYGTYTVQNGVATLDVRFNGLERGGTYSLWCAKVSKEATIEWPCIAGGEPIKADRKGLVQIQESFPALPDATAQTGAWLWLAYHSDFHQEATLNDFGKTTHIQTLSKLPTPAENRTAW